MAWHTRRQGKLLQRGRTQFPASLPVTVTDFEFEFWGTGRRPQPPHPPKILAILVTPAGPRTVYLVHGHTARN